MFTSRSSFVRKSSAATALRPGHTVRFWEERALPVWLPIFLGVTFGVASGALIAYGLFIFLVPLAFIIPVAILFARYPFAAVMVWILIFPFLIQETSTAGRVMYTLIHRAMIPTALGIVILSDWLRIHKREPVRLGRAELVMLLFLIMGVINITLLTANPTQSLVRFYDRLFVPLCMYMLIRLSAPSSKDLKRLAWAGMITVIIQSIIGIFSWFAPQVLPPQWLNREGERTVGTFGNPAVYTSTLIFLSLLLLQHGMQTTSRRVRAVAVAVFSLAYFCVFLSFSRGSWLGGSLVIMGLIFIYPKMILRWLSIGIALTLLLAVTILAQQIIYANQRLQDQDTAQGRVLGATTALRMIKERPWFGWGFGNYDVYDEQFKTRVENLAIRQDQTSHNTFLLIMVEMGAFGLIFYIFPPFWWLMMTLKVLRRFPKTGFLSWHLLVMLWLLMLDHFVVSNFMEMIHSNLFGTTIWWMALSVIASVVAPYLQPSDTGVPRWAQQAVQHPARDAA